MTPLYRGAKIHHLAIYKAIYEVTTLFITSVPELVEFCVPSTFLISWVSSLLKCKDSR